MDAYDQQQQQQDDQQQLSHFWPSAAYYHPLPNTRPGHCQNMSWFSHADDHSMPLDSDASPLMGPQLTGYPFYANPSDLPGEPHLLHEQNQQQHQQTVSSGYGAIGHQHIHALSEYLPPSNMPYLSPLFSTEHTHSMNNYTLHPVMQYRNLATAYTPLTLHNNGGQSSFMGYSLNQGDVQNPDNHAESPNTSSPGGSLDLESTCSSESDWQMIDHRGADADVVAISNPGLTLHTMHFNMPTILDRFSLDTSSAHSSTLEGEQQSPLTPLYPQIVPSSSTDNLQSHSSDTCFTPSCSSASTTSEILQLPTPSPERHQPLLKRETSTVKPKKNTAKVKKSTVKKELAEQARRKGGRQGPLLPEQRKGAGEIRKIRACLRCKFLKKTCDTGEVCSGCKPSHARLWQVPCTRVDIRDVGYFLKGWNADCHWEHRIQWAQENCTFAPDSRSFWFSHDLGYACDIKTCEVSLKSNVEGFFDVQWIDDTDTDQLLRHQVTTAKLAVIEGGITKSALSDYLDRHIQGQFDGDRKSFKKVVEWMFGNAVDTCLLRQVLATTFSYYQRTNIPLVHTAIKFVLAYNLTNHVLMVHPEEEIAGKVDDETSSKYGRTIAPALVNLKMKLALAEMWRELHKEVLDGLSKLYTGVYNGDKVKNWPTIFIVSYLLLAVWEEMQFDTHYRKGTPEDRAYVKQFLKDMEVPTGVILGLFAAISQKLPALREWDTKQHGAILNNDVASCKTLTELQFYCKDQGKFLFSCDLLKSVLTNVVEEYISECSEWDTWQYLHNDFDCMNSKYTSRLVVRVN